jgi:nitroreductase
METIEAIKTRRSVRAYTNDEVDDETITSILEAGRWAPSGLNNQPWRFIIVRNPETKVELAKYTAYGPTIKNAPVLVVIFLDKEHMYNYVKDVQSIGACIQNMLLSIHSLGLGGVWLGEILKNKEMVNSILEAPDHYELMAIVAIGHHVNKPHIPERKELDKLVFCEKFGKSWK